MPEQINELYYKLSLRGQEDVKRGLASLEAETSKHISKMGESAKKLGAAFGIAFGTTQIIQFGKEAVLLAAKAEGIERAFNKLDQPGLLNNLREATKGTVSDLQLMQVAIKAENFKIPLDTLAKGLKFAQIRARETGESVDYLVDSLITGIGRKSLPIMDNLQISTIAIQEEFRKTGDFGKAVGNILERELKMMGDQADTAADKVDRLNATFENMEKDAGKQFIEIFNGAANAMKQFDEFMERGMKTIPGVLELRKLLGIRPDFIPAMSTYSDLKAMNTYEQQMQKTFKVPRDIKLEIQALNDENDLLNPKSKKYLENLQKIDSLQKLLAPEIQTIVDKTLMQVELNLLINKYKTDALYRERSTLENLLKLLQKKSIA